ncbi:MAG: PQQ-binding-like beta-propeller repeat protein [Phycisphaeraceae bacterium]
MSGETEAAASQTPEAAVHGWLNWRGPEQNGVTRETNLPSSWEVDGENHLWSIPIRGRSTPVIAGDRLYAIGYVGESEDLREVVFCADAATGEIIWEHYFSDFLSDVIYNRYSVGAPAIDPETGNIYVLTTPGLVAGFTPDGELLWDISLLEEYGRLTFPNGRTGAPVVDGDRVIIHCIAGNWGAEGPTRDRFYAFDKSNGDLIWSSNPSIGPPHLKDSSFSTPFLEDMEDGRRVFYAGMGDGNIVKVDARTGEGIWRFPFAVGGVNASVVRDEDRLLVMHGLENANSSQSGGIAALDPNVTPREPGEGEGPNPILPDEAEQWRVLGNEIFSTSPVVVDGRAYVVDWTGILRCIEVATGEEHWNKRLGPHQLHASALYGDGKLYVGLPNGTFYILEIKDDGAEILSELELEGSIYGTPSAWNGRVYVFTTEKLYAFGSESGNDAENLPEPVQLVDHNAGAGEAVALRIVPGEVAMRADSVASFRVQRVDAQGRVVDEVPADEVSFSKHGPRGEIDATFDEQGRLVVDADAEPSAGAFKAEVDGLVGYGRGRVLTSPPFSEDFSDFELTEYHERDEADFAYPPSTWLGARLRWEIRELDGEKVLAKALDIELFQRAITFIGHPDSSGYTVQADVMTDGTRRLMSDVGVINQRYIIALKGNHQQIEVSSNSERLRVSEQYIWNVGEWQTLKTRVDVNEDGSGVVRAKAWPRGSEEPSDWLIEVPVEDVHVEGAPGVFGFSPQSRHRVYLDNLIVKPND